MKYKQSSSSGWTWKLPALAVLCLGGFYGSQILYGMAAQQVAVAVAPNLTQDSRGQAPTATYRMRSSGTASVADVPSSQTLPNLRSTAPQQSGSLAAVSATGVYSVPASRYATGFARYSTASSPETQKLVQKWRQLQQDPNAAAGQADQVKLELRDQLATEFAEKHQQHADQIEQLSKQLEQARTLHQKRGSKKDEIIDRRLGELLGSPDDMGWNVPAISGGSSYRSAPVYAPTPSRGPSRSGTLRPSRSPRTRGYRETTPGPDTTWAPKLPAASPDATNQRPAAVPYSGTLEETDASQMLPPMHEPYLETTPEYTSHTDRNLPTNLPSPQSIDPNGRVYHYLLNRVARQPGALKRDTKERLLFEMQEWKSYMASLNQRMEMLDQQNFDRDSVEAGVYIAVREQTANQLKLAQEFERTHLNPLLKQIPIIVHEFQARQADATGEDSRPESEDAQEILFDEVAEGNGIAEGDLVAEEIAEEIVADAVEDDMAEGDTTDEDDSDQDDESQQDNVAFDELG